MNRTIAASALVLALLARPVPAEDDPLANDPQQRIYRGEAGEVLRLLEPDPETPPRDGILLAMVAYCHAVRGDADGAVTRAEEALAKAAGGPAEGPDAALRAATRAWALTARGAVERARGDLEKAEATLREAMEALPTMAASRYELGETLKERADRILHERVDGEIPEERLAARARLLVEARKAYEAAARIGGRYPTAIRGAVRALWGLGEYGEAMQRLRLALDEHPGEPLLMLELGVIQFEMRRYADAARTFRGVVKRYPDWSLAWVELGNALDMLNDGDGAVEAYEKAIELAPEDLGTRYNLGVCHARNGRWERALELWRAEEEMGSRDPLVLRAQIEALRRLHREDEIPEVEARLRKLLGR